MPTQPDLSSRPYQLEIKAEITVSTDVAYQAWTTGLESWFAVPGTLLMKPEINSPFFFETEFEDQRHAHYGRFLKLVPDELLELTWVTGDPGTKGAETVVTIRLEAASGGGTRVTLTQAGFADEEARDGHEEAWPLVMAHLDECLKD